MANQLRTITNVGRYTLKELPDRRWEIITPDELPSLIVSGTIPGLYKAAIQLARMPFCFPNAGKEVETIYTALVEHNVLKPKGQVPESPVYYETEIPHPWLGQLSSYLKLRLCVGNNNCRSWTLDCPLRLPALREPAEWASMAIRNEVSRGWLQLRLMGLTKSLGIYQNASSSWRDATLAAASD